MNRGMIANAIVYRKAVWGGRVWRVPGVLMLLTLALGATSCGDVTRQGAGSSYLIINQLEAATGAEPNRFTGTLNSDVITIVDDAATIYNDYARVRLGLAMKDVGVTSPTTNNFITVNRYHVKYVRSDGRNTPGVDVPYAFDGAATGTVGDSEAVITFEVVRHIAKVEAPLSALARNLVIISTIAEITFYGSDQTGREVQVTGKMLIDFGNFGDPN